MWKIRVSASLLIILIIIVAEVSGAGSNTGDFKGVIESPDSPNAPIVFDTKDPRSRVGGDPGVPFRFSILPKPPIPFRINWRVSGDAFVPSDRTSSSDGPAPLLIYKSPGFSTLIASAESQVRPIASRLIFSYNSIFFGCSAFTFAHGIYFDSNDEPRIAQSPNEADIYTSGTHCSYWQSTGSPFDTEGALTLRFPGGGIFVDIPANGFSSLSSSAWTNDTSAIVGAFPRQILLFKTRDGRIVKLLGSSSNSSQVNSAFLIAANGHEFIDEVKSNLPSSAAVPY